MPHTIPFSSQCIIKISKVIISPTSKKSKAREQARSTGNTIRTREINVLNFICLRSRAQCIIDQYSGYKVDQVNQFINGRMTQGENIADNGGIKQAYRVRQDFVILQWFYGIIECKKHHISYKYSNSQNPFKGT